MIDLNDQRWQRFGREYGYTVHNLRYRHSGPKGGHGDGKRFFERGKFKFALLELLASQPMHRYQMIKAMEEKTGGLYTPSPGSVYPNLQLLEDMQLISSKETDGKKLYRITNEGLNHLREMDTEDPDQQKNLWEHLRQHGKHGGGHGKHLFRALMKEWPEVIQLMFETTEKAKETPSSKQAAELHQLMTQFQKDLNKLLVSMPNDNRSEE